MTKEMKEFIKMMKDPEVKKALAVGVDLTELIKPIKITEDDSIETVVAKQQEQLQKIVEGFTTKLAEAESKAEATSVEESTRAETERINTFSAGNPGMKDPKVIAMMQPLYNNGMSLEDAYAKACKVEDIDPTTGVAPVEGEKDDKKDDKAKKKKETKVSSNKSALADDVDDDDPDDEGKDKGPISLQDALAANSAALIAKNGNPFED